MPLTLSIMPCAPRLLRATLRGRCVSGVRVLSDSQKRKLRPREVYDLTFDLASRLSTCGHALSGNLKNLGQTGRGPLS